MIKKIQLFILIFFIMGATAHAVTYYRLTYIAQQEEDLGKIVKKFVKTGVEVEKINRIIKKNKSKNPQVESWEPLSIGQVIDLYIPKKDADEKKIKKYKKYIDRKHLSRILKRNRYGAYYVASRCSYEEKRGSYLSEGYISLPVGIGGELMFYRGDESPWIYKLQAQYHRFITIEDFYTIPDSYRGILELTKYHLPWYLSPSVALEYQKFSHLERTGSGYQVRDHKAIWGELSVALDSGKYNFNIITKLSYAHALKTSSTLKNGGDQLDLSGYRLKFFFEATFKNKYFLRSGITSTRLTGDANFEQNDYEVHAGLRFE